MLTTCGEECVFGGIQFTVSFLNLRQAEEKLHVIGCDANQLTEGEFEGGRIVEVLLRPPAPR